MAYLPIGTTEQTNGNGVNGIAEKQLTDRIILSPHAAKRLSLLLGNIVKQYEDRFGQLNIDVARAAESK